MLDRQNIAQRLHHLNKVENHWSRKSARETNSGPPEHQL